MIKVLIRMPKELKVLLKQEADRMGITMNALLLKILWESDEAKAINQQH